jgi:hypothetical protein
MGWFQYTQVAEYPSRMSKLLNDLLIEHHLFNGTSKQTLQFLGGVNHATV